MKLSKAQKIGIGILTCMPILCLIGYLVSFFSIFIGTFSEIANDPSSSAPPEAFFSGFAIAFVFLFLMIITGLASLIIHIIHITKNQKLKQQDNGQLIWILIIIFANSIGGIIYYFMEILPEPKQPLVPIKE
ncbi:PLDc N-terminal domain-containing protein [Dokdonia sp.]|uniref:PLDc N-terminal domain-containing protein n=1 Tax=Dokdonia sp. TaxID=2024995 RepID=UPI003267E197